MKSAKASATSDKKGTTISRTVGHHGTMPVRCQASTENPVPGFEPEKQDVRIPSKVGAPLASDRRRGRPDLLAGSAATREDIYPGARKSRREKDAATTAIARGRGERGHGTSQRKLQAEQPIERLEEAGRMMPSGRGVREGSCRRRGLIRRWRRLSSLARVI